MPTSKGRTLGDRSLTVAALIGAATVRERFHHSLRRRKRHEQLMPLPMTSIEELEDELSRPGEADVEFLRQLEGDILILGAAGKMGPSLARLCRRAADAAGPVRRILAGSGRLISAPGIDAISCDLLDRAQVARLPECPNVLYLAGRKFGSSDRPELTWAMNTVCLLYTSP